VLQTKARQELCLPATYGVALPEFISVMAVVNRQSGLVWSGLVRSASLCSPAVIVIWTV
jgi:hypothetical protein